MTTRDLINTLLDFPMDLEIAIGIVKDNEEGMDIFAINTRYP